ncbi:hypothetical protein VQ042_23245 [Aurantimonas sp. A2-1-M11]|uniref:hypothetical protein n=1 Tax=Aurantimonas sp. A2-1-M11 TaxID=3113712 RepID=UPI002F947E63
MVERPGSLRLATTGGRQLRPGLAGVGSVTRITIVQLLLAGISPPVMCVVFLMITVAILAHRHDLRRSYRRPTLRELGGDSSGSRPS